MFSLKAACLKKVGEVIFRQAKKEANSACPYFHHQPKVPKEVKSLGKFGQYDKLDCMNNLS